MSEAPDDSLRAAWSTDFDPMERVDRFCTDGDNVVVASGEIDLLTAPKLWEALELLIQRGHREIVLDMAGVEFMDSQGLSVLLRAYKVVASEGGMVTIRAPRPQTRKVLEISGVTSLLRLEG